LKVLAKPIAFNPPIAALRRYHRSFAAYGGGLVVTPWAQLQCRGGATTIGNIAAAIRNLG